jgi:hypothetical protein
MLRCHGSILFTDLLDPSVCIASWKASLLTMAQQGAGSTHLQNFGSKL